MSQSYLCTRIAEALAEGGIHDHLGYEALAALKLPGLDYRQVLGVLHRTLSPRRYVEIGVRDGATLELAGELTEIIGIDPAPKDSAVEFMSTRVGAPACLSISTSDAFFSGPHVERARNFGLALIDGDHTFFQALKDFENLERLAGPASVIAIHDVIPMDARTATPECTTSFWTGDVWRLMAAIVAHRPDLVAFTIATAPTGLGIVAKFGTAPLTGAPWWEFIAQTAELPLDMDWAVLTQRLNIVPNDPAAIIAAFTARGA